MLILGAIYRLLASIWLLERTTNIRWQELLWCSSLLRLEVKRFILKKILNFHWHLNYARSSLNPCVSHDVFISDICHKELCLMVLLFDLHYVLFLSPDEKYILTGGEEDLVTVWSMEDRKVVAWGEGHNSWVQFQQNFVHINWVLPPSLFFIYHNSRKSYIF